ncbi:MAG: type IV pilus secretin PilQ [Desulfotignum sp.]|nr:type IV pilus secretin PilQ [Desulfotignum sp.]
MGILISYRKQAGLIIIFCAAMILNGCTATQKADQSPARQFAKWQARAEESRGVTPVPHETSHQDTPAPEEKSDADQSKDDNTPLPAADTSPRLPEMPLTMHMNNVSLPALLRTLAKIADLNMIINDSITGQTQLVVNESPWDQVFTTLLESSGLAYDWSGDILQVFGVEDYKKRQSLLEARSSYENAKTKQLLARQQLEDQKRMQEPLTTEIVNIRYANLESMQKNLNQYLAVTRYEPVLALDPSSGDAMMPDILSGAGKRSDPGQQGSIMMDQGTSSLIIHASRSDINKLMPVIRQLDRPVKQVWIEAHIVEAESSTGKALGIQWGGLANTKTSSDKQISVGGDISPFGQALQDDAFYEPVDGNVVSLPMIGQTGINLGIMAQKMGSYVLYTQLMALQEDGVLNILSKPSITTQNHQKAVIKSGKEIPYQTVENDEVSIEWKEAVIKLEVTPHVIDDKIVRLEILTHKDELDFSSPINGNPTIITKNAETSVTLLDGQTTVIGGLNKEKNNNSEKGVPGLKDVPGLGWLFKNMSKDKEMEELLIFITPHILENQTIAPAGKG